MAERWIVAPKVEGSSPSIYPINFTYLMCKYTVVDANVRNIFKAAISAFLYKTLFLYRYYVLNDLIWQEAFLIDFVQKKTTNKWIQKFLIISSYLFNERLLFDYIIRFSLDFFLWPAHKLSMFDVSSTSNLLNWLIAVVLFIVLLIFLVYLIKILF